MRSRLCAILAILALAALLPLPVRAAPDATGLTIKIDAPATAVVGQPFTFTVAVTNNTGGEVPISVVTHTPELGYEGEGTVTAIVTPGLVADGGSCNAYPGCFFYYNSYPHAPYALPRGTTRLFEYTVIYYTGFYAYPRTFTFSIGIDQVEGSHSIAHYSGSVTIPVTVASPSTSVVGTPDRAANANGWYRAPVTVTFSGTDATAGIASCTRATYSGPDSATATVFGSCTNSVGNITGGRFALKYDATRPTVTYAGNAGSYDILDTVAITCAAADNLSGIDTTTCKDIVGPAYTYHPGANTFSATATDKAGNVGSGQTSFTVTVTVASLSTLVDRFVTNKGIANSLTTKIEKGHIQPFVNKVNAQTGKTLTGEQAATLIGLAKAL